MQGFTKFAALLLAMPMLAIAARPPAPAPVDFSGSAWVDVDADGKAHVVEVGRLSVLSDVPALAPIVERIQGRLRNAIESWQFVPAMRDGIAVASRTNVSVDMRGTDDGAGGFAVRLRSARTGPGVRSMDMGPLVSVVERAQAEGSVKVDLAYDEAGNISSAEQADSKEFAGRADKVLRRGALAAVKTWHMEPEVVDGHPRAGSGSIVLVFCLETPSCGAIPSSGDDRQHPQEFAATDPAVKLRSAVAGTAL
jgi:hypothetical protein